MQALDFDLALAVRARQDDDRALAAVMDTPDGGGFFAAVIALLNRR